jgi:hypothetical protein
MKRISTMRYEIAKDLTPEPRPLTNGEKKLRRSILRLDGLCEYCEKAKASAGFGDHFYPIIFDKYPSEYCNDEWNRIPACNTCNTSKSGRTWEEWFESNYSNNPIRNLTLEEREARCAKFRRYDKVMQKYCQRKKVNRSSFDELMTRVLRAFTEIDESIHNELLSSLSLTAQA